MSLNSSLLVDGFYCSSEPRASRELHTDRRTWMNRMIIKVTQRA